MLETDESGESANLFGHDPSVSAMMDLVIAKWLLGRPDQAQSLARQALPRAETVGAAQSIASALHVSMTIALLRGELDEARRFQDLLQQFLQRNALEYCYMRPLAARTSLLVREGRPEEAIGEAREGIALARDRGALAFSSVSLTALAEAQLEAGRIEEGLASIHEALEYAEQRGERVWLPETRRIEGRLLRAGGQLSAAEDSLRDAMREAREDSLLALQIRASCDFMHLLREQEREQEAYPLLEGVVNRFEEGFTTIDYRKAQSLLSSCKLPAAR
jgi:ATP/maltotriose-dependent transcriptional regulator MalT